jgi:hypothetical protein
MKWLRLFPLLAVLGLGVFVSPAMAGDVGGDQDAVSTGAAWLSVAKTKHPCLTGETDPVYGGGVSYDLTFVDPGRVIKATGPLGRPGEADLRKPWVSFSEEHFVPAAGCHGGFRTDVRTLCSSFANTDPNWTLGAPGSAWYGQGRTARLAFDFSCNDGRGYDSYRYITDGYIAYTHPAPSVGWGWGTTGPGEWSGGIDFVGNWAEPTHSPDGSGIFYSQTSKLCGHDSSGFQCEGFGGGLYVNLELMHTSAHLNS